MNYLEQYYSNYDEEGRLLSKHGQVEYITTMKYIHNYLDKLAANDLSSTTTPHTASSTENLVQKTSKANVRILEVGAGTGRYCVALAQEGYTVDAVELTEHNLQILREKITKCEKSTQETYDTTQCKHANTPGKLTALQGNALDLSMYADNTYDLTLVLGPLYHLYNDGDRMQALSEAVRVTKPGGHIMIAYCMNEAVMIQEAFVRGNLKHLLSKNMLSEDFHCLSNPEDLFAMMRLEEIYALTDKLPVTRLKIVATDGATNYMRGMVDAMDEETFDYWVKYHLSICERQDLIGATNHSLDILQKNRD